jgi:ribosome-associated heat shock protein Hsp15
MNPFLLEGLDAWRRTRWRYPIMLAMASGKALTSVRVDKWLWAARLYKSRTLATAACDAGHVKVDGGSVKPARQLHRGERVRCLTPGGERVLEVVELAEKRTSAAIAQTLYLDHTPPRPPRKDIIDELFGERERGLGRPSKRDRRQIEQLRERDRDW